MNQSSTRSVGLDIHKASLAVASIAPDYGADVIDRDPIGTRPCAIDSLIRTVPSKANHRIFVCEAGSGGDWTHVPGLQAPTIPIVLAEVGFNRHTWPTDQYFAPWLGRCPDNHISGGTVLSTGSRRVHNRASSAWRMAAQNLRTDRRERILQHGVLQPQSDVLTSMWPAKQCPLLATEMVVGFETMMGL